MRVPVRVPVPVPTTVPAPGSVPVRVRVPVSVPVSVPVLSPVLRRCHASGRGNRAGPKRPVPRHRPYAGTMTDAPTPESDEPAHDPEVLELAQKVFDLSRHGDTDTVAAYVNAGVPANLTNDKGDSLLMLAAYHGHPDTVRALLSHGADPNRANDRGQTPLAGAVFKGEDEVVRVLVDAGADPQAGAPSAIETARMFEKHELLTLFGAH